jgi:hypothetical protein
MLSKRATWLTRCSRVVLTSAIALAIGGLIFPAPIFAQPALKPAPANSTVTVDLNQIGEHLKDLPTVFTVGVPDQERDLVFLKGADGFFYSDARNPGLTGFVSLEEAAQATKGTFTVDEAAGTFSGFLDVSQSPDKVSSMAISGEIDPVNQMMRIHMTDKAGGISEFTIAIPDLGLDNGADKFIVVISLGLSALALAALILAGCAGILYLCLSACEVACPPDWGASVTTTFCGIGSCECSCIRPPIGPPECV